MRLFVDRHNSEIERIPNWILVVFRASTFAVAYGGTVDVDQFWQRHARKNNDSKNDRKPKFSI